MSKKHVAGNTGADTGSDGDHTTKTTTVDLGIGITVDLDADAVDDLEFGSDGPVELPFDESSHRESGTDSESASTHDGATGEYDVADATVNGGDAGALATRQHDEFNQIERDRLEAAGIDPDAVRAKEYSYRMLLDANVDDSTAATLRRRFSLPWSFESDGDLDRRSSEVRGLGAAEREWIAVSSEEDWQSFEYETTIETTVGRERPSERPWPKPTPVTAVTGVGPDDAAKLAEAGIHSAKRLAMVSAFDVANALDLNVLHVRTWRHNARELRE